MSSSHTMTGLFRIDVRVSKVESMLNMESPDVLIIGIWGMGGIGKTTIAQAVCNKVCSRFERIVFANLRQKSDLQRKFLKQLLGQETLNTMGSLSFRDSFVRERLRRIKIFIVLDDVHNLMRLEELRDLLDGRNNSFGPGSKVLITSRDKQMLNNVVDETYEVKGLNYKDAIQLFSSKALKNCIPTIDQRHLIEHIACHVQGNPLALKVLGSSLYGKSIEEWRSALKKLDQDPQIERALRISYDGLDSEQKSIFLDIAHFFICWNQNNATRILDGFYGRSVIFDISTLIDKCLITAIENFILMHDLLREMAFNIVRAESDFPGERSRLCHLPDVVQVLEENKGTQKIKGISLDISKLSRHIHLKSDAFAMMDGLRFLSFYHGGYSQENKMHLPPTGLEYLPNELRYLRWIGFPLKSLPPSFRAEHLVELHLSKSKLVKLWTGVKDVGNLRKIDLSDSPYLTELPDLSKANNLECLILMNCPSLTEVPSSVQYLDKLEELNLAFCNNLRSFPMLDSKVLRKLIICQCLDVTTCPKITVHMKSLQSLNLSYTGIKEIPSSSFKHMISLQRLNLSYTGIKEIPSSSFKHMISLHSLSLSYTGIKEIPSSSFKHMISLQSLNLRYTGIKEIPSSSFKHMISLRYLYIDGTPIKELPLSIKDMVCLEVLSLSRTPIKELPLSIKDMACLKELNLHRTPIKALPELPPSLSRLRTHDCASLETTISIINIGRLWHGLDFRNCFKLDQKPLVAAMHLKIQSGEEIPDGGIQMVLPGSEIPEWFGDKGIGSSLTIQLPSNCHQLKGIAFCFVSLLPLPPHGLFDVYFDCHVKSKNGENDGDNEVVFASQKRHPPLYSCVTCDSDHMILRYSLELVNKLRKYSGNEVTFKFYRDELGRPGSRRPVELKSRGVSLHFDENLPADTDGYRYLPVNKQRFRRQ